MKPVQTVQTEVRQTEEAQIETMLPEADAEALELQPIERVERQLEEKGAVAEEVSALQAVEPGVVGLRSQVQFEQMQFGQAQTTRQGHGDNPGMAIQGHDSDCSKLLPYQSILLTIHTIQRRFKGQEKTHSILVLHSALSGFC